MLATFLLAATLGVAAPEPASSDQETYQAAARTAGRDSRAHVDLALWCEARGMNAERLKHLTRAVLLDPGDARARGLLGMVEREGKWLRPEEIRTVLETDSQTRQLQAEYLERRAGAADTADAQMKLARWCEEQGLADQAQAHYRAVLRHDPDREGARKALGYRKSAGRWGLPEEITAEKAREQARKVADRHWRPILERLRDRYSDKSEKVREQAKQDLDAVADPLAVPVVWRTFVVKDPRLQRRAAETFARIDGQSASLALAELAVFSDHADVRGLAADLLDRRDPRDYLDPLLDLIRKPFHYAILPIAGEGSEGRLFVEGEQFNIDRRYSVPVFNRFTLPRRMYSDDVPLQGTRPVKSSALPVDFWNGSTGLSLLGLSDPNPQNTSRGLGPKWIVSRSKTADFLDEAILQTLEWNQTRVELAKRRMLEDVVTIEQRNSAVRDVNDRVLPLVSAATGQNFGADSEGWNRWWTDQKGYAYQSSSSETSKPTYTDIVDFPAPVGTNHGACFVAGTSVHTMNGPRPIEDLQVGDVVLSQNVESGAVSYKPVLLLHRTPTSPTLRLTLGGETIGATGIHRFWRPGHGWTMARDLKPGDVVRTLGGTQVVQAAEPGPEVPVFNLDVADDLDFFVGQAGFLVHDFSIVRDPSRPFDALNDSTTQAVAQR